MLSSRCGAALPHLSLDHHACRALNHTSVLVYADSQYMSHRHALASFTSVGCNGGSRIMAIDFRVHFLRVMVREWNVDQRKFLVKRKLQGATLAVIQQEYACWWPPNTWHNVNAPAPTSKFTQVHDNYLKINNVLGGTSSNTLTFLHTCKF